MRKHILLVFLICLFFAGCALRGPDTISIIVESSKNGTVTVDKDELRFGETLEITVNPDKGYRLGSLSPEGAVADPYDSTKYYYIPNSGETSKKYQPPVTSITIKGIFTTVINKTENFTVVSNVKHGTVSVDGDRSKKHAGDIVTFSLTVDEGYNLLDNGVRVKYDDKQVAYEITADGKYSFEMPENSVFIEADILNNVHLQSEDYLFVEKGKTLTIDVRNISNYTTFDAYINTGKTDSDTIIGKDLIIENGQVVVDSVNIEPGYYNFYLMNESFVTSNIINIRVGYEGYNEEWTSVIVQETSYSNNNIDIVYEPAIPRVLLLYYPEGKPEETVEYLESNSYKRVWLPFEQTEEEQNIVVKFYDPYLKIVSSEITVSIPAKEVEVPEENPEVSGDTENSEETENTEQTENGENSSAENNGEVSNNE